MKSSMAVVMSISISINYNLLGNLFLLWCIWKICRYCGWPLTSILNWIILSPLIVTKVTSIRLLQLTTYNSIQMYMYYWSWSHLLESIRTASSFCRDFEKKKWIFASNSKIIDDGILVNFNDCQWQCLGSLNSSEVY